MPPQHPNWSMPSRRTPTIPLVHSTSKVSNRHHIADPGSKWSYIPKKRWLTNYPWCTQMNWLTMASTRGPSCRVRTISGNCASRSCKPTMSSSIAEAMIRVETKWLQLTSLRGIGCLNGAVDVIDATPSQNLHLYVIIFIGRWLFDVTKHSQINFRHWHFIFKIFWCPRPVMRVSRALTRLFTFLLQRGWHG